MNEINFRHILYPLGLDDEEIDELVGFCPKLEFADTKRISTNISLLVTHGYPECDLKELFLVNPRILVYDNKKLLQKLINLGDDIEEKIKDNPHFI